MTNGLTTVAQEEIRDRWIRGWWMWIAFGISLILGVVAAGMAYTAQINLLDAREGMNILVRVSLGAALVLMLFTAADSVSGERERSTLESLLLTPLDGRSLVFGKLLAAWFLWLVVFVLSIPYLWVLGSGLGMRTAGIGAALVVGVLLAALAGTWATMFSLRSSSNVTSVMGTLATVLALGVPAQIPGRFMEGPIGTAVRVIDPITAALEFLDRVLVGGAPFASSLGWLLSPLLWSVGSVLVLYRLARAIELEPGA